MDIYVNEFTDLNIIQYCRKCGTDILAIPVRHTGSHTDEKVESVSQSVSLLVLWLLSTSDGPALSINYILH